MTARTDFPQEEGRRLLLPTRVQQVRKHGLDHPQQQNVVLVSLVGCLFLLLGTNVALGKTMEPPPPPPPPPPPRSVSSVMKKDSCTKQYDHHQKNNSSLSVLNSDNDDDKSNKTGGGGIKSAVAVLKLTETEVWDGTQWRTPGVLTTQGGDGGRWSSVIGDGDDDDGGGGGACDPPGRQRPWPGYRWEGDWKILTGTSTRDSYGWEYSLKQPQHRGYPVRRRIWLRNMTKQPQQQEQQQQEQQQQQQQQKQKEELPTKLSRKQRSQGNKEKEKLKKSAKQLKTEPMSSPATSSSSSAAASSVAALQSKRHIQKRSAVPGWIRAVSDDFNFKGFGVSYWKGVTSLKSGGITFKIPVGACFNRWHSNPCLPNLNFICGVYYPPMAVAYFSSSIRLAWFKWSLFQLCRIIQYAILNCLWTCYRGLLILSSALLFPVTRQLYNPPFPVPWVLSPPPEYGRDVDERVGCSYAWRYTPSRGFFKTCRLWHYYAPTVASLYKSIEALMPSVLPEMPLWIPRHSAELGLDIACLYPDPPFFSAIVGLCLSGFYLKRFTPSSSAQTCTASVKYTLTEQSESSRQTILDDDNEQDTAQHTEDTDEDDDDDDKEEEEEELDDDDDETDNEETDHLENHDVATRIANTTNVQTTNKTNTNTKQHEPVSQSS